MKKKTEQLHLAHTDVRAVVARQIAKANKLLEKDYYLQDVNALIKIDGHWLTRPGRDHQGLRLYLLLGCFDAIGREVHLSRHPQPKFTGFPVSAERKSGSTYSIEENFLYFINGVMNPEHKKELLQSISVKKIGKYSSLIEDYPASGNEKLRFLLDIRNAYDYNSAKVPAYTKCPDVDKASNQTIGEEKNYYYSVQWDPELIVNILYDSLGKLPGHAVQKAA